MSEKAKTFEIVNPESEEIFQYPEEEVDEKEKVNYLKLLNAVLCKVILEINFS